MSAKTSLPDLFSPYSRKKRGDLRLRPANHLSQKFLWVAKRLLQFSPNKEYIVWRKTLVRNGAPIRVKVEIRANRFTGIADYRVVVTGPEQKPLPVTLWIFENGLLLDSNLYLSANDASYFTTLGTQFQPEGTFRHIQGTYKFETSTPDWSAIVPDIGFTSGATNYLSKASTNAAAKVYNCPSMYTGLMRLAMQAKLARGTVFANSTNGVAALFPESSDLVPAGEVVFNVYGLLRAPDYTYFVIRTFYNECKAYRMTTSSEVQDLVDRLIAGSFLQDTDKIRAEAVVMSTLRPERDQGGNLVTFNLLGEADITPVQDPAIEFALAYAWHYSYPPLNECSIIRHGTINFAIGECAGVAGNPSVQYQAYKTTLSFTFVQNQGKYEVQASGSTTIQGTKWFNYADTQTIWVPDAAHNDVVSFWQRGCPIDEVSAPLYCWYDNSGYRDVWINSKKDDTLDEIHVPPLNERRNCFYDPEGIYARATWSLTGLGGVSAVSYSLDGGQTFNFESATFDPVTEKWTTPSLSPVNDTHREWVSEIQRDPAAPDTPNAFRRKNFMGVCPGYSNTRTGDISIQIIDPPDPGQVYYNVWKQEIEAPDRVPYFCTGLILPRLNAESVVLLDREAKVRDSRFEYYDDRANVVYFGECTYDNGSDPPVDFHGGFEVVGSVNMGGGRGWALTLPEGPTIYSNYYEQTLYAEYLGDETERKNSGFIIINGVQHDIQYAQDARWDRYFNKDANGGQDALSFSAPASVMGNARFPKTGIASPSVEMELLGDYADQAEIESKFQFVSERGYWLGWT